MKLDENPFHIDPDNLVAECLRQPELMELYTRRQAKARRVLDELQQEHILLKATLDKQIRAKPGKFNVNKVTDKAVDAARQATEAYQESVEAIRDAQYEVDLLSGALTSLSHKKEMLSNMVRLAGMDWFSEPTTTTPAKQKGAKTTKRK